MTMNGITLLIVDFPSIRDFEDLCKKINISIYDNFFFHSESKKIITNDPNKNADNAIFVIEENQ